MEIKKFLRKISGLRSKGLDTSKNYFPSPSDEDGPWHGFGDVLTHHASDDYENGFDNITKIAYNFAKIQPYLTDANGETVKDSKVLDAIYSPNKRFSAFKFRLALMTIRLVHDEFYLRVHYKGSLRRGKIPPENITGFTFIEGIHPFRNEGKWTFPLISGDTITEDEVLIFRSLNPNDLSTGYSPSRASRRWTRLDDYIADYQAGFFRNGAVPSGQFIITAAHQQDYLDIKEAMQKKHRGAGKNNNVVYSWRPVDTATGKPVQSQIEWVQFNTHNKDLALKDLLDAVTRKIDSSFGVPAEIRGHLQNSNYASVIMAQNIFVEHTLDPLATELWSDFTHELARVTGGFGAAIAFKLDKPIIAEEEEGKARAQKTQAETLTLLIDKGFTLESIVAALHLPDSYKSLSLKKPPATEDKPEVQQPGEASDEQNIEQDVGLEMTKRLKSLKSYATQTEKNKQLPVPEGYIRCKCCDGFGEHDTGFECYRCDASGSVSPDEDKEPVPCDGRSDSPNIWIDDDGDYRHAEERKAAKHQHPTSKSPIIPMSERESYERQLQVIIKNRMNEQVRKVVDNFDTLSKAVSSEDPVEEEDNDLLANEMYTVLIVLVGLLGPSEQAKGLALLLQAGLVTSNIPPFQPSQGDIESYQRYLKRVARGYNAETAQAIRDILEDGFAQQQTAQQIKTRLQQLPLDGISEYRARRLAISEVNRAGNRSSLISMLQIQQEIGAEYRIEKLLETTSSEPCPMCSAKAAESWIPVDSPFWTKGEELIGSDGKTYLNNFIDAHTADLHPFCQCREEYRVVRVDQ